MALKDTPGSFDSDLAAFSAVAAWPVTTGDLMYRFGTREGAVIA